MRKQINGLAALVSHGFSGELLTGDLFLFCGRNLTMIKALYWDSNGFCLWTKRVEKGSFPWPRASAEDSKPVILTRAELAMILDGIDFRKRFKPLHYSQIA